MSKMMDIEETMAIEHVSGLKNAANTPYLVIYMGTGMTVWNWHDHFQCRWSYNYRVVVDIREQDDGGERRI